MADTNGDASHVKGGRESSLHLGKRKRSSSPEKRVQVNGQGASGLQNSLITVLEQTQKSDMLTAFLRSPIPTGSTQKPNAKRARLSSTESEPDTIEHRILSGIYQSKEGILEDVELVRNAEPQALQNGTVNGDLLERPPSASDDVAHQLIQLLSSSQAITSPRRSVEPSIPSRHAGQIIMLRSATEKGVSMLYSGLQSDSAEEKDLTKDGRRLPNGFDLAEPATMDANVLAPSKQIRNFGDVFGPHRNTKALEMPRSRPTFRSNTLSFSSHQVPNRPAPVNRPDYKHQQLQTDSWLTYAGVHKLGDDDPSRRYRDKNAVAHDFRAALIANDVTVNQSDETLGLFKKAFSSFAPTSDSTTSLISAHDRQREWWRKHGTPRIRKIFSSKYPDPEEADTVVPSEQGEGDEFAGVIDYVPTEAEEALPDEVYPESIDEVLDEISQLLETVHSYQRMRSLESRPSADATKPSTGEFDTYELLRSQLAILIASVPPFAVSKLDGDKLSDLNISTNVMVNSVDYRGTMQPDDFTLSKYRTAHQSAATRMPQVATPNARTPYPAQNNVTRYGANLQSYAHNLGLQAQYAQRQAQQYSTPQNIQRNYQTYQQAGSYSAQPNLQQFQRPGVNGFGGWSNANSTPQTSFAQSPSQPGYQQRAQQQPAVFGGQSPSRPMANGQITYQNTPYQRPQVATQQNFSPVPQQTMQTGVTNGGQ
ncbi:uncharacterized protein HMPREF1541_02278 [Cyphellophora europaea CBS 101466]|uniref:Uncharacterized protein n=1 Tax=Cyphellophora europaea (strain CBS 101466) TaxID=1220924 RepID=W2S3D4_CYPE1|nr:uncharacterized protein HMPREF1541_02278 [Cyphellophora europaea CBS 101466]ETN43120.1 hypothetical protein HMPREF1541_02278 [Cyphellophora europaea CBS 101466]